MFRRSKGLIALVLFSTVLSGCSIGSSQPPAITLPTSPADDGSSAQAPADQTPPGEEAGPPTSAGTTHVAGFGLGVAYQPPTARINPAIAKDFDVKEIQNLHDMEKAYGFTFSPAELAALGTDKFVVKSILDTNLRPGSGGDNVREFTQLYGLVAGTWDYKARAPQNAVFLTSDVFFNAYNNLYTELLKEMENKTFYPAIRSLSVEFEKAAQAHLDAAKTDAEKKEWTKVRNYFVIPAAIFSTVGHTLTADDYSYDTDPAKVLADFKTKDATIDTLANVEAYVAKLKLDADSQAAINADLKVIYAADDKGIPAVFGPEYKAYADAQGVEFKVDFSQFTPRSTYTSSSLRRQYFRGMKWYIMVPFFLKSPELTTYAYGVSQLMAEHPDALGDYNQIESAINFMVGSSDDLMPADYLAALTAGKGATDPTAAAMAYLVKAHDPKIKDLAGVYPGVGVEQSSDVLLKTKGMRFFSGKFILDSYWTGYLTQGDEAIRPGYTQKLPPMASALEVMTLLGSDYAKSQIPKMDLYAPSNAVAINQALAELQKESDGYTDKDWEHNLYTGWLWTIKSLFTWQQAHKAELPMFMHSLAWEAKTLMTADAWWTELRHATILYAKQSFAELGGGGGCDVRTVPPPPKGYIEPQAEAYARLSYLAKRTEAGLTEQGFQLQNIPKLQTFIATLDKAQTYVDKELQNTKLDETVTDNPCDDPDHPGTTLTTHDISGVSDWEALRTDILRGLQDALPVPLEGPVLPTKDRRAALVADVHTGGDSSYPTHILYEGEGVPYVIFAAVDDVNGPRLTVGFTYSHYEFTKPYGGQRLTDEEWQKDFYQGDSPDEAYKYTGIASWPKENVWYAPLFTHAK